MSKETLFLSAKGDWLPGEWVTTFSDGTTASPDPAVTTEAVAAQYCGGLYNRAEDGRFYKLSKQPVQALSSITPSEKNLRLLLQDYGTAPVLLLVDVSIAVQAALTIPSTVTILKVNGADFVSDKVIVQGKDLSSYLALSGRPVVASGAYLLPQGPMLYDQTIGSRYYGAVTPGGNSDAAKTGDVWFAIFRNNPGSRPSGIHLYNVANVNGAATTMIDVVVQSEFTHGSRVALRIKDTDNGPARFGFNEENPEEVIHVTGGNVRADSLKGYRVQFATSNEPDAPPAGQIVEWFDGTSKKVKFADGRVMVVYSKPMI